eukprot:5776074-Prymnesium_polylepis.1
MVRGARQIRRGACALCALLLACGGVGWRMDAKRPRLRCIAASHARAVSVGGDGDRPGSGEGSVMCTYDITLPSPLP